MNKIKNVICIAKIANNCQSIRRGVSQQSSSKKLVCFGERHSFFNVFDVKPNKAIESFFDIIEGKILGMHVKSFIPKEYCKEFESRFHKSPIKRPRGDDVPGYEAGVTQYKKNPHVLSELAYGQHGHIRDLLGDVHNPIMSFFRAVAIEGASRGFMVRPASFGAEAMPIVRAIQWVKQKPNDKMLLEFHDDIAQVKSTINDGFEIQHVKRLIAYNFYPRALKNSGQLAVVDWQPNDQEREKLGVPLTGYPYKQEDIPSDRMCKLLNVETGDLVVMDGSYVHGVIVGNDECQERLIVNGFAALLENNEIVLFA